MGMKFRVKLLLFVLSVVLITTVFLVIFFINNFNAITDFSLKQNTTGIRKMNEEYLVNLANDKARLISQQFKNAINSIAILGKAAQKIIDNYDELAGLNDIYKQKLFSDNFIEYNGAITNPVEDDVNILIPPPIKDEPRSKEMLKTFSLLNLVIGPVFESNENNTFVYFVGDKSSPITRAYPNFNLAEYLGEYIDLLFWKEFFVENVEPWERFYTDEFFQDEVLRKVGTPVTFDPPYEDAAGQGKIITLFYPLWNNKENKFAGVVAADVSLAKIVENILAIEIAETGFAFLINGRGEIIAVPEEDEKKLKVDVEEIERGGLKYYYRSLSTSQDSGIREVYENIMQEESGYLNITMDDGNNHILVYSSLGPINDTYYNQDNWKILISVPEEEILSTLFETDYAIRNQNTNTTIQSLLVVCGIVVIVIVLTIIIAGTITKSIGQLATAANMISKKDYNIKVDIKTKDEIGNLGRAFMQMSREIKNYTEHLEDMVKERTEELEKALSKISELNEKLKDENLRLSAELDVAKQLQLMVLPGKEELKSIKELDIACTMNPADEVGGDYYDLIKTNGIIRFGIGDVTGHGLAAGVIMLMAQTAIKTMALTCDKDMKSTISLVNKVMQSNITRIKEDKSMTLSLIDYKDRTFSIVGQHESIIVCRKNGTLEIKDTVDLGMYIGLESDISEFLNLLKVTLEPGDIILLYTDGVTEAVNTNNEEFGIKRLAELVRDNRSLPAQDILKTIVDRHNYFIGNAKVYDDISLIVIKQR